MEALIPFIIFISLLLLLEIGYFGLRSFNNPERRAVQRRLQTISFQEEKAGDVDIVRKRVLSNVSWLHRLLSKFPVSHHIHSLIEKSGVRQTLGIFLLFSLLFLFIGYLAGNFIAHRLGIYNGHIIGIPAGIFFGMFPYFYIRWKMRQRVNKFEDQLPEALELIARSLKAGHAFTAGLKMVADEMADPIGTEFGKTLAEINFGLGIPEALKNLAGRVECEDLKFFVISIILQRETGGNLAEILDNLSHLIRERVKFQGRVRSLAAQGRLTAYVLVALPFLLSFVISLIRPGHFEPLFTDPAGKTVILVVFVLLIGGIVTLKKMVVIRV